MQQIRPRLVIPSVLYFLITILLLQLFVSCTGLSDFYDEVGSTSSTVFIEEVLKPYVNQHLAEIAFAFFIFILITFFVGAGFNAWILTMVRDATHGVYKPLLNSFKDSKVFYWRVVGVKLLGFVIMLLAIIVALIVLAILSFIPGIGVFLGTLFTIIFLIAVFLSLLFRHAILFMEDLPAVETVKKSISFFKYNKKGTFITALCVLLVSIALGLVGKALTLLGLIGELLYMLLVFIVSVWASLYIFNVYRENRKKTLPRVATLPELKKATKKKAKKKVSRKTTARKRSVKRAVKKTSKKRAKKRTTKKTARRRR